MNKYRLVIDADHILYNVTPSSDYFGDAESIDTKASLKPYKKAFRDEIQRIVDDASVEAMGEFKIKGKPIVVLSDTTNFRYELFPEYKSNRKDMKRPEVFYRLRDWARSKYLVVPNFEADDVVAWYVREKECVGATADKDLIYGVAGKWFDVYHTRRCWTEQGDYEAQRFVLMQTLAGDLGDGIPGLPRVGIKTAEKLLGEVGFTWDSVVQIYKQKGFKKKDAILTRRLVGMDQLVKQQKKWKLKLWSPN